MSSARIGDAPKGPRMALADNVIAARRDVQEAEEELKERPSYMAALKVQILKKHWQNLREIRLV